jgi:hypothetical protein
MRGVAAVAAIHPGNELITIVAIDTVVAVPASIELGAIEAVIAMMDAPTVAATLAVMVPEDQIAVLGVVRVVHVLAILVITVGKADTRNGGNERLELLEERPTEVEIKTIVRGIPVILPPGLLVVDGKWGARRIRGNDLPIGPITFAMVQVALVAPDHAPLLPAVRAQSRRRNLLLLAVKDWGNLVVECEILRSNLKCR